jgi:hypothetical protein
VVPSLFYLFLSSFVCVFVAWILLVLSPSFVFVSFFLCLCICGLDSFISFPFFCFCFFLPSFVFLASSVLFLFLTRVFCLLHNFISLWCSLSFHFAFLFQFVGFSYSSFLSAYD